MIQSVSPYEHAPEFSFSRNAQPVIPGSDKWGVHEVRSFYKYLSVSLCLSPVFWTGSRLVNHLLHSKGRAEVKAGVYVCPGHTHIRSDLIGAECTVCLPMAPEPTWPRKANLYGLCKQGLCLQRSAGNQADSIFIHACAENHTLKRRSQGSGGGAFMCRTNTATGHQVQLTNLWL